MRKLLLFLCIIFLVPSVFGNASATPVYFAETGHYYEWIEGTYSWTAARSEALSMSFSGEQGYLATITSEAENAFVTTLSFDGWLGGSDAAVEGTWVWMDGPEAGEVFWLGGIFGYSPTYAYWRDSGYTGGEPNNAGDEDYLHLSAIDGWNDLNNNQRTFGFFVEYNSPVPEPATLLLLGFGLVGLAGVRRRTNK